MNAAFLKEKFNQGKTYEDYLASDAEKAANWQRIDEQVDLNDEQRTLISGFVRDMHIFAYSGIWCGDCVQQGPLVQKIAAANDCIHIRWFDRDEHPDLGQYLHVNQGNRVPMFVIAAEDFEPVAVLGDRTLTRYRALAAKQLGPSCPLPGAPIPDDELRGTLQDWLDEVERVQLLLRLSGRLRQKHGD